jgi:hypothetical protein
MEMEFAQTVKAAQWIDIFKGSNLRRTEITVMVWVMQQMCGVIFAGNVVFVFEQAGISQQAAFDLGLGTSAIQLFSNFINMYLMFWFGRRTLYFSGFVYSAVNLIIVGVTSILGDRGNISARWVQAAFQMVRRVDDRFFWQELTFNRHSWLATLDSLARVVTPSWARLHLPGCETRPSPSPVWFTP